MYQDYRAAWAQLTAPGADFEVVTTNVRGVDIRTYAKAPGSLRDLWLSTSQFADRDYLVYNEERLTYAETHQRVASLANWLIDQGVQPGDRVAIAMRNYPEWMQAYWAITSIGAAVVGMNAWWIGPEMLCDAFRKLPSWSLSSSTASSAGTQGFNCRRAQQATSSHGFMWTHFSDVMICSFGTLLLIDSDTNCGWILLLCPRC